MPDIAKSGCMILWGYNPSYTRITHPTAVVEALKRGMRLIVIDPRHVGLANKADLWLRVRPGTDGALALGVANLMIERGWYDRDFSRDWSNDTAAGARRLLTADALGAAGDARRNLARNSAAARLVPYDTATGHYDGNSSSLALEGEYRVVTAQGEVVCHSVFELYARLCRRYPPEAVEAICWVPRAQVEEAKSLIWQAPGVLLRLERPQAARERHANGARDVVALCADRKLRPARRERAVPDAAVSQELPSAQGMSGTLGLAERPLGPARWGYYTTSDLYRAIREGKPHPVRDVIGFGASTSAR
jgi:anaerobic selenocysteine-containing dehydrogenase